MSRSAASIDRDMSNFKAIELSQSQPHQKDAPILPLVNPASPFHSDNDMNYTYDFDSDDSVDRTEESSQDNHPRLTWCLVLASETAVSTNTADALSEEDIRQRYANIVLLSDGEHFTLKTVMTELISYCDRKGYPIHFGKFAAGASTTQSPDDNGKGLHVVIHREFNSAAAF